MCVNTYTINILKFINIKIFSISYGNVLTIPTHALCLHLCTHTSQHSVHNGVIKTG